MNTETRHSTVIMSHLEERLGPRYPLYRKMDGLHSRSGSGGRKIVLSPGKE
jgi:hypothetical protein